jgi:MFS family permease
MADAAVPDVRDWYVTAAWCFTVFLGILLLVQSRCKCDCAQACSSLERIYLPVYVLAICADWLQGPYVYALYASYGYDRFTIDALFVVGFSASMVTGPFVGALADHFGVKRMILMGYCVVYMLACVTKHFDSLPWLYLGRLLGGTATSVLFSCFESWLVAEYTDKGQSK